MTKRGKKVAAALGAVSALVGVAALAHVPSVRVALGASSCPWSGKAPSAEVLEQMRIKSTANLRGARIATSRPAFGFSLGTSTKGDAARWGKEHALTCADELGGAALRCEGKGDLEDVLFRFGPKGTLVAVDVVHAGATPEDAATLAKARAAEVAASAGAPSVVRGEATRDHLAGGRFSQFTAEFRFSDYAADIVATNLGNVVVREQYRSLAP